MSVTSGQNPHPLRLAEEDTCFWPKIEIKGRIRQVLDQRIRRFIKILDKNLKHRLLVAPSWIPVLLLASTQTQATFNQFSDNTLEEEVIEADDGETDEDGVPSTATPDKCVVIYVRVSTDEQKRNGRSIDSQIDELVSVVENDPGIELYREPIRDEGETGTDFDRDGIQQVARIVQRSDVTHLMVDTIDRIGRSVAETLMFVHELREKFDVKLLTRHKELDVRKPTDRMQVTMLAMMADFGTRNRARSSLRSSADNFLKNKQWRSWYQTIPFGYEAVNEEDDKKGWIRRVEKLEPVIEDIYTEFISTKNYSKTAEIINTKHKDTLEEHDGLDGDSLSGRQIKAIVSRSVYRGEPTISVTDFEHYDSYPSVDDPSLRFIDKKTSQQAQEICTEISEKYSTDEDLTIDPDDYPDEFNPYIIETVNPTVRLICPDCSSDLIANGHQRELNGNFGSRIYKCTNKDCGRALLYTNNKIRVQSSNLTELRNGP